MPNRLFQVKPENKLKDPTAEQKKVLGVIQYPGPLQITRDEMVVGAGLNRQQAFDKIKEILQHDPIKKRIFRCWKADRRERRQARRQAEARVIAEQSGPQLPAAALAILESDQEARDAQSR